MWRLGGAQTTVVAEGAGADELLPLLYVDCDGWALGCVEYHLRFEEFVLGIGGSLRRIWGNSGSFLTDPFSAF